MNPEEAERIMAELAAVCDEATRALTVVYERLTAALAAVMPRVIQAMQPIMDAVRASYEAAGAPYGSSDEGMLRWLGEESAKARAAAEMERQRLHDWAVADFRRQVAEKRGEG